MPAHDHMSTVSPFSFPRQVSSFISGKVKATPTPTPPPLSSSQELIFKNPE